MNQTKYAVLPEGPTSISLMLAQSMTNQFNLNILQVPSGTHEVSVVDGEAQVKVMAPRLLGESRMAARIEHLSEELLELNEAYEKRDMGETVDGLIDLIYIAISTLSEMHVNASRVFSAVHEANMQKVNGTVAKRPNAGNHDAVKPEGWKAPDINKAIYGESNGK
ncbi:hydrolase [Achromobacter phage 83-24]|uniref:Phosphoribosyl-ATP pyrophosphohydrolase n=1 Tax=Achromobacter phage 83-24 TaxID=1589747 RepID=A0A0B5A6V2_9CAUD|nr:hydrolase [Achromobacter phage 83-24]AJD82871.1 phosphoribosyl-ATP pyrophosphohydrolase [Achromobacter phage 83-24]